MEYYIFGKHARRNDLPDITWCPDSRESKNPHALISAGSGSGKTTLLVAIASYLERIKKHIFIFDLKGDMIIHDNNGDVVGNYIKFTAWNSEYGINPFEFDTGVVESELLEIIKSDTMTEEQKFKVQNSGPKVQVERIIEIIKKNFLPNMGANQKDILMYLFSDTYLSKGFKYDDVSTWTQELPSLNDTLELINRIRSNNNNPEGTVLDDESIQFVLNAQNSIVGLKTLKNRLSEPDEKDDVQKLIDENRKSLHSEFDKYIDHGIEKYTEKNISINQEWFEAREINTDKYATKEAMRTIEKMASYINALVDSGVFHSKRPPVKNGLNIINISGLDVNIQRFIVDIWLGKVFKSCKIKGDYSKRANKPRGEKCDTYVIIDESKLIAGSSRDKNDPYSFLNRIATEARGFGLGIIVAAQSAEHFPPEFLKNFDTQIILNTSIADYDSVRRSFGLDKNTLEFVQNGWGHALIKSGKSFIPVKLRQ